MKKLLSTLLAGICTVACAFSFAACGNNNVNGNSNGGDNSVSNTHTSHDWSKTYTIDGDEHYQTCSGCDEKKYGGHDYGTSGVCVCGKTKPETFVAATAVKLDKNNIELNVGGEGKKLTATVEPENATDKKVTYSVEPAGIVSVDKDGNVTALAAGTAVITTTTTNGKTATCDVTVTAPITNAEIIAALESYFLYPVLRNYIGRTFTQEKLSNVISSEWYLKNNSNSMEVIIRYNEGSGYTNYIVFVVDFVNNIDFSSINKTNLSSVIEQSAANATYNLPTYSFMYNESMLTERAELKNAICDKVFGENESATRFIKDNGYSGTDTQLGEVRQFTVVEITEDGVKEISINIKNSSNDTEYISKLSNSSNYRTYDEKSYDISGTKLSA